MGISRIDRHVKRVCPYCHVVVLDMAGVEIGVPMFYMGTPGQDRYVNGLGPGIQQA